MTPTQEQQDCIDTFLLGDDMKINAYAGSGKTSTLELLSAAKVSPGVYLCFNKSIATAASARFPSTVACKTTHSFAYRSVIKTYSRNSEKMVGSLRARDTAQLLGLKTFMCLGGTDSIETSTIGYAINQTIRKFCMSAEMEIEDKHYFGVPKFTLLPPDEFRYLFNIILAGARTLWEHMVDPATTTPLGHDGYVKVWQLSQPVIDTCFILVDEAQDTSPVMLDVLARQETQVVYVGDKHQQIYEWRGAINAMETVPVKRTCNLTKSFRFGQAIADFASDVLAKIGETNRIVGNEAIASKLTREGQRAVLCRTNAQILDTILFLDEVAPQDTIHVIGGVKDLIDCLDGIERLQDKRPSAYPMFLGFKDWNEFLLYSNTSGDMETKKIVKLCDKYGVPDLKKALGHIHPSETSAKFLLTTAHKAKGREWDGVELANDFKSQPEKDEDGNMVHNGPETRLFYVAATRAINRLKVPQWSLDTYGAVAVPTEQKQEAV